MGREDTGASIYFYIRKVAIERYVVFKVGSSVSVHGMEPT